MSLLFGLDGGGNNKASAGSSPSLLFGISATPSTPATPTPTKATQAAIEEKPALQSDKSFPSITDLLAQNASLTKHDSTNLAATDITTGGYGARFVTPVENLPWYMRPGRVAADTISSAQKDLANRFQELTNSLQPDGTLETQSITSKERGADRVSKAASVGLGIINTAFLPFTTLFKSGEQLPVVGDVFKAANNFVGKVGEIGSHIGDTVTEKLPVSENTKKSLKPVLGETFGLLAQFGMGAITHEVVKDQLGPLSEKTKKIISEDPLLNERMKKQTKETPATQTRPTVDGIRARETTAPIRDVAPPESQYREVSPAEISKIVDNSLERNQTGVREKSVSFFKDNPADITSEPIRIREVDGKLTIEDGRHRLQAAKDLGISNIKVEDVTPKYTGKTSVILDRVSPREIRGTGPTNVRGLSAGVEQNAIEKKLTTGFGDLPEYQSINMKDQAKMAVELMKESYDRAKRIALGQEPAPQGLHPEAVFTAVEARAIKEGDVPTLKALATKSSLTSEATTMGQRIKLLDERNPDSPVKAIRDVAKAREEAVKKRVGDVKKEIKKVAKDIKAEVDKAKPTKQTWKEFIHDIQCA